MTEQEPSRILVGTAGWSYADWKGIVYPPGLQERDFLPYLSRFVDCVEVNVTFYRIPDARMVSGWLRKVRDRQPFWFTAKLWQGFSHGKAGEWGEGEVAAFRQGIEPLREAGRLGALLLQFPWFLRAEGEGIERVERLADAFSDLPLVVEARHRSWTTGRTLGSLERLGISFCNVDLPQGRTSVPPSSLVTGPIGYVRLHGRNYRAWFDRKAGRDEKYDYLYEIGELEPWVERSRRIASRTGLTFVVANNHYRGQALVNALQLRDLLGRPPEEIPELLAKRYPGLGPPAGGGEGRREEGED